MNQTLKEHREWYSRGYLPHFDHPGIVQMITLRLADALPANIIVNLKQTIDKDVSLSNRTKIADYLDVGHGSCILRDHDIALLMEETLLYYDGKRYRLLAWVVMPNHVHVMIEVFPQHILSDVVSSWKSFTANKANRFLKRKGRFWQPDYFDRFIRNSEHFENSVYYIHKNPVKAGLVRLAEDWEFSSSSSKWKYPLGHLS